MDFNEIIDSLEQALSDTQKLTDADRKQVNEFISWLSSNLEVATEWYHYNY